MTNGTSFNKLTPAEAERLALLAEECGEVIQAVGKILRHGFESYNPTVDRGLSNKEHLEKEIGHLLNAVTMLTTTGNLDTWKIEEFKFLKKDSIAKYLHHQEALS